MRFIRLAIYLCLAAMVLVQLASSPVRPVLDRTIAQKGRAVTIGFIPFYRWRVSEGFDGFEIRVRDPQLTDTSALAKAIADTACAPGTKYDKTTCSKVGAFRLADDGSLSTKFSLRNEKYKDLPKNPGKMAGGVAKAVAKLDVTKANPLERRLTSVAQLQIAIDVDIETDTDSDTITIKKLITHVPEKKTRGPLPDAARIFDPDAIKRRIDESAEPKTAAHKQPERVAIPERLPAKLVAAQFVPDDDGDGFVVRVAMARDFSLEGLLAPLYLLLNSEVDANPKDVAPNPLQGLPTKSRNGTR
jgi:hypothetical protein